MSLREDGIKALLWHLGGRYASTLIIFIIGLVLARLLTPADYGLVGMLNIFLAISSSFVDSGFNSALIQKKDTTDEDFSTVFIFNLAVAIILYLLLYAGAPLIADFYHSPALTEITRVIAFSLIINGFYIVQRTILTKRIDFKTQTKISIPAALISGLTAIILAYFGFGPWALVANILLNALFTCLAYWHYCHWIPKSGFSKKAFYGLFHFGGKILVSSLLTNIYNNLHTLIIGRVFAAEQLGFFTKANTFATLPSQNVSIAISSVTLPVYSKLQDNDPKLQEEALHYLKFSTFFIFPAMLGIAAISTPLIKILLTEKWAPAAPLLTILCFGYMWHHIQTIDQNVMLAKGFSNRVLYMEIIKKAFGLTLLIFSIQFGIPAMCWAFSASYWLAFVLGLLFAKSAVGFSIINQLKAILPSLTNSVIMFILVNMTINLLAGNSWSQLLAGISAGIVSYSIGAFIFTKNEAHAIINRLHLKGKNNA